MAKYVPPGFNAARIIDGIHKAMGFGEANSTDDVPTFYLTSTSTEADADDAGIPWDPDAPRQKTRTARRVDCTVDYIERAEQTETFGVRRPSGLVITLLGPDYEQIKGFDYVVCGGDKYYHVKTDPPAALGSIDVWTVRCKSQDER